MNMENYSIEERIALVREDIARAADGRDVTLVGVSKTKPAELVRRAVAAGLTVLGENYVQEFREKAEAGAYEGAEVHIIGHLQKNKVKYVVGKAALIQSVDSIALLAEIGKRAASLGIVQDVLAEVNIGGEDSKSGLDPAALPELLGAAGTVPGVRVRGLMAIPPAEGSAAYFPRLYHLFIDNKAKKYDNVSMDFLSMGMSEDYEAAICEGANMVRVGSLIFGPRRYL